MIDNESIDRLKEIFVTRLECDNRTTKTEAMVHSIDKRITVLETYNKVITWMLGAIGSGVIALVIKQFWG